MKPSHTQTPRTIDECTFLHDYSFVQPSNDREPTSERIAGYVLVIAIGLGMATLLVQQLSM